MYCQVIIPESPKELDCDKIGIIVFQLLTETTHNRQMRNQAKVLKTVKGTLQINKAWSKIPKSA